MSALHGYYLEDLSVGQEALYTKTVTEADIVLYAGVSGDTNPVHLDAEFAGATMSSRPSSGPSCRARGASTCPNRCASARR